MLNIIKVLVKSSFRVGMFLVLFFYFAPKTPLLAYDVIPVKRGGELFGSIKFMGEPPPNRSHQVLNNPEFCGSAVLEETTLVNPENHGLKNVVISIEKIERGKKPLLSSLVLENRHCHFVPHVQMGMVGSSYEIRNSDPVLHNTHLYTESVTLVNVAMPASGNNIRKTIVKKGIINAKCDAHKFMQGWIFVSDNPYGAVTDQDGNYRISDIPPGKYKIGIWHESLPLQEKEVVISPEKETELSIKFPVR
ncbi:MAG: hypothetical protein HY036_05245 [Nitrospirae bacterium]|nr:hypothetical protein [Nitrospirota bacterium]MBI3351966.1 hypothetical protein [Nitrospirota bacterium]